MSRMLIRKLKPEDGSECLAIVGRLPDFFGSESGIADCALALEIEDGLVATSGKRIVGFLTLDHHTGESVEITWMAVDPDQRGVGIGSRLIEQVVRNLKASGGILLSVKTSAGPSDPTVVDNYGPTRAFYIKNRFVPLMELKIWETDYALLMVRPLRLPPRPPDE